MLPDRRESRCYLEVTHRRNRPVCSVPLSEHTTRAACCCSRGRAWGHSCELCPTPDSEEFEQLCPGGPGFRPNTVTVSDKLLYTYI